MEILVNIDVPELEAGIEFYSTGLGFEHLRTLGGRVAEMRCGDCRVYLLAKAAGTAPFEGGADVRRYERHWTPVHLDLAVTDVAAAVERARRAGARVESDPASHSWGTIAQLADPFGNGLCVIEFTEAGYDAVADSSG
ncbi:MAG: VOC family protein [Acidobacteria bacterium]|nr:MAG: VOC family protein [Acidobacteriota bacterium]REK08806.1 MAG: VOC family protein [Acidobacteriota bacterium]